MSIRRRIIGFLVGCLIGAVLCLLWPELAGGQTPATLSASWQADGLQVVWGAPEPGCLVLSGGPPDQLLADIPCSASGSVLLKSGGVDQAYAPQRYLRIELRAQADLGRALARAPTWRLVLPMVEK